MGAPDPRLDQALHIDFRLQRMLKSYAKQDPPPDRVKPVPTQVLRRIMSIAAHHNDPVNQAIADMICIAFFFLLRPGEYAISTSDSTPFTLADVQLFRGDTRLDLFTASSEELLTATFSTLTFTTQKNGVRGEVIGHSHSGDQWLSPPRALARRVLHLRNHHAPATTPLAVAYTAPARCRNITPLLISSSIRDAVTFLGPGLGFTANDVSARCLRAAGANALLCAGIDTDVIRLLGRWRSDEMMRYLHCQARPVLRDFAQQMLHGGSYTLIPNQLVPAY